MRALIQLGLWSIIFTVLQVSLTPVISLYGYQPDFLLILTLVAALKYGRFGGLIVGFLTGLIQDAASIAPLGGGALIKANIGFFLGMLWERRWMPPRLGQWGAIIFLVSFIQNLVYGLLIASPEAFGGSVGRWSLFNAVYTATVGMLIVVAPFASSLIVPQYKWSGNNRV